MDELKKMIRSIPDFPSQGIMFRDITTVLKDPKGLNMAVNAVAECVKDINFNLIIGPESRGFIFGVPLAYKLNKGFIPARKSGKLPAETAKKSYDLEYGTAVIEIHKDAVKPGDKIIIADDLLATGGTAKAVADLVTELGAEITGMVFFIELTVLNGREILSGYKNIKSVVEF